MGRTFVSLWLLILATNWATLPQPGLFTLGMAGVFYVFSLVAWLAPDQKPEEE